jgi:transcriptional regulator with XRE-family HTH domain
VSNDEWPARLTAVVAEEVQRYRRARHMTVNDLSEALAQWVPMATAVLYKLEQKKRATLSVAELLALAAALEVPPARLVFPLEHTAEPLPDVQVEPWAAIEWFNGQHQLLSAPQRDDGTQLLKRYREHQHQVDQWRTFRARLSSASAAGGDTEPWENGLHQTETWLTMLRAEMRQHNAIPPSLPADLAHVDFASTEPPPTPALAPTDEPQEEGPS